MRCPSGPMMTSSRDGTGADAFAPEALDSGSSRACAAVAWAGGGAAVPRPNPPNGLTGRCEVGVDAATVRLCVPDGGDGIRCWPAGAAGGLSAWRRGDGRAALMMARRPPLRGDAGACVVRDGPSIVMRSLHSSMRPTPEAPDRPVPITISGALCTRLSAARTAFGVDTGCPHWRRRQGRRRRVQATPVGPPVAVAPPWAGHAG